MTLRGTAFAFFGFGALSACSALLNTDELTSKSSGTEAGADAPLDASLDAKTPSCSTTADCPIGTFLPAGCAVPQCLESRCVYAPIDADKDGHPAIGCFKDSSFEAQFVPGDDCRDGDPTLFPGAECGLDANDKIVASRGGAIGICKDGIVACESGGIAVCNNAVKPLVTENCATPEDDTCDGVAQEGCGCTVGTVEACGNAMSLGLPCKAGQRTCGGDGKWGACVGNVERMARDCGTSVDNDCNGAPDNTESTCKCGTTSVGQSAACQTHPGLDGVGICKAGAQTCNANGSTAALGACSGSVGPAARNCSVATDNDCNGTLDNAESTCGFCALNPTATFCADFDTNVTPGTADVTGSSTGSIVTTPFVSPGSSFRVVSPAGTFPDYFGASRKVTLPAVDMKSVNFTVSLRVESGVEKMDLHSVTFRSANGNTAQAYLFIENTNMLAIGTYSTPVGTAGTKTYNAIMPLTQGTWYRIGVALDLVANTVVVTVDGAQRLNVAFSAASKRTEFFSYGHYTYRSNAGTFTSKTTYWDNLLVTTTQ